MKRSIPFFVAVSLLAGAARFVHASGLGGDIKLIVRDGRGSPLPGRYVGQYWLATPPGEDFAYTFNSFKVEAPDGEPLIPFVMDRGRSYSPLVQIVSISVNVYTGNQVCSGHVTSLDGVPVFDLSRNYTVFDVPISRLHCR